MKVADKVDILKISDKFTIHFGVTCPCVPRQNSLYLCFEQSLFIFYWIFMRLVNNLHRRHKICDKFEFRLDQTIDFGVSCPLVPKNAVFDVVHS